MSCSDAVISRAGKTLRMNIRLRDKTTKEAKDLTGYKARMTWRLTPTAPVALLDIANDAGLVVQPAGELGLVTLVLTATQSRSLAPNNQRTESVAGLEIYDDGESPEEVVYSEIVNFVMSPEIPRES